MEIMTGVLTRAEHDFVVIGGEVGFELTFLAGTEPGKTVAVRGELASVTAVRKHRILGGDTIRDLELRHKFCCEYDFDVKFGNFHDVFRSDFARTPME